MKIIDYWENVPSFHESNIGNGKTNSNDDGDMDGGSGISDDRTPEEEWDPHIVLHTLSSSSTSPPQFP